MIISFADKGSEDIALAFNSNRARKLLPPELHGVARRKLAALNVARSLNTLASVVGTVEKLSRDRKGQFSIRINNKYRICFRWEDGDAYDVEVVDYH